MKKAASQKELKRLAGNTKGNPERFGLDVQGIQIKRTSRGKKPPSLACLTSRDIADRSFQPLDDMWRRAEEVFAKWPD